MRKMSMIMIMLALALLLLPSAAGAQELASLFSAVSDAAGEGLQDGAAAVIAAMDQELTVDIVPEAARIEEGKTIRVTVTAGNPRPQETEVSFALQLPGRLTAAPDTAWTTMLAPAQYDEAEGRLIPSQTVFTREIALAPGGGSETAEIACEMQMGTRFYRAKAALALCVPDIDVTAKMNGAEGGRLQAGDTFAYDVEIVNSGTAPKDVAVELMMPEGMEPDSATPGGFERTGRMLKGVVRAEAAANEATPSRAGIHVPLRIEEELLEGDADAMRLMSGALRVDGKRVPLPRVQVCGPRIMARLTAQEDALEAGAQTALNIVVVNSGLAPAQVEVSCVLPKGLEFAGSDGDEAQEQAAGKTGKETKTETKVETKAETEATPSEIAAQLPPQDGDGLADAAEAAEGKAVPEMKMEGRTLIFKLQIDAAKEEGGSLAGATQVIEIPVRAQGAQEHLEESLMGASLSWRVDGGEAQLGEAVALRVYAPQFLGLSDGEWSSVICAGALLMLLMGCLYAAMRGEKRKEDYCFD